MNVETLIYAYLAICVSMIVFNFICIFTFKQKEINISKKSKVLKKQIAKQMKRMKQGNQLSEEYKAYLCKKLKKTGNLMAFDETMEDLLRKEPEAVKQYLTAIYPVFLSLSTEYRKKDEIQAAYFLYVIRQLKILQNVSSGIIIDNIFEMLYKPSLYCRENALQAIYSTGDCGCVTRALKIIDAGNWFHHSKLLTDGLLNFAGSREKLSFALLEVLDDFSTQMKVTILNYFRFSTSGCCKEMMKLLTDKNQEDEIRFSCIRYFGKYHYEPAQPVLLELAQNTENERWEYAAIASLALGSYPSDRAIQILKHNLNSSNWYIRFNASQTLLDYGLSYTDLVDVFDGNDRYAREILQYRLDQEKAKQREVVTL